MKHRDGQRQSLQVEDAGRVSLLSHDIRATYAELQSALRTLAQSPDSAADLQGELSRLAHTSAHLGRLLEEVSEALFPNYQHRHLPSITSAPRQIVIGIVARWQRITAKLGMELTLTGTEQLPEVADLDMLALEQVLSNLVSNALHHAGSGPISIEISRSGQGPQAELLFYVRDSGSGYPPIVLNRPHTDPTPVGAGEPGSGFGLHVAFDATRRLNGKLTLRNPPEGGAEACLALPFPTVEQTGFNAQQHNGQLPEGLTALLVEDSPALRMAFRHDLEALGLKVTEAHDGVDALERLMSTQPQFDLVFLDIELPLLSGVQVLSKLRAQGREFPPTIAITSHVFQSNRQSILSYGAKAILSKPVNAQRDILDAIAIALGIAQPPQPQTVAAQEDTAPPHPANALERSLHKLIGHLPPSKGKMILAQLSEDLDHFLDAATSATKTAPPLERHAILARTTHSLSSLFATAYMKEAQHLSRVLSEQSQHMTQSEIIETLKQLRQYASDIQATIHSILSS
ncbi:response regulator [Celeribacter halophilus]|uniref:response regulator n=1 Tax=Celeribacter halophilus TaxID=576117 RepID=UPI003A8EA483